MAGYDPRKELGIAAKAGRPPTMIGDHTLIAAHYLALCDSKPSEKIAASTIAELWGITSGRVRKIARDNIGNAKFLRSKLTDDVIADASETFGKHRGFVD